MKVNCRSGLLDILLVAHNSICKVRNTVHEKPHCHGFDVYLTFEYSRGSLIRSQVTVLIRLCRLVSSLRLILKAFINNLP